MMELFGPPSQRPVHRPNAIPPAGPGVMARTLGVSSSPAVSRQGRCRSLFGGWRGGFSLSLSRFLQRWCFTSCNVALRCFSSFWGIPAQDSSPEIRTTRPSNSWRHKPQSHHCTGRSGHMGDVYESIDPTVPHHSS